MKSALCDVISAFSHSHSLLSCGSGSVLKTSTAAPAMLLFSSAVARASSSTASPRPIEMKTPGADEDGGKRCGCRGEGTAVGDQHGRR